MSTKTLLPKQLVSCAVTIDNSVFSIADIRASAKCVDMRIAEISPATCPVDLG